MNLKFDTGRKGTNKIGKSSTPWTKTYDIAFIKS